MVPSEDISGLFLTLGVIRFYTGVLGKRPNFWVDLACIFLFSTVAAMFWNSGFPKNAALFLLIALGYITYAFFRTDGVVARLRSRFTKQ